MTIRFPLNPRALGRTALIHLLASGAISAWALNLALDPPGGPLPAGQKFEAIAKDDKGAVHPCTWALLEKGSQVGLAQGLRLDIDREGARFHAPYGETIRTFKLLATSRMDGKATAEITLQVQPGRLTRYLWDTPFRTPLKPDGEPMILGNFTWDPTTDPASIVAIVPEPECIKHEDGYTINATVPSRVVRIQSDGSHRDVAISNCQKSEQRKPGDFAFSGGHLAIRKDGGIVVSDVENGQILLLKDGAVTILAGIGTPGLNGDTDELGRPRPATQACLNRPGAVAVTAKGEVVFVDESNLKIRRINADGTIGTVLDVEAAYALKKLCPSYGRLTIGCAGIAEAPDGRIVFTDRGNQMVCSVGPGGDLRILAGQDQGESDKNSPKNWESRISNPGSVTVTPDASVIFINNSMEITIITPDYHRFTLATPGEGPAVGRQGEPLVADGSSANVMHQGFAPVPGGGLLTRDFAGRFLYLGPGRGEPDLVRLVDQAATDAKAHGRPWAERTLAVLDGWTVVPRTAKDLVDLRAAALSMNEPRLPGLPVPAQGLIYRFLHGPQESAGRAIQALVARHVLLKRLDALVPESKGSEQPTAGVREGEGKALPSRTACSSSSSFSDSGSDTETEGGRKIEGVD